MFSYLDREETVAAERALLAKVDCVFAINAELAERKRAQNPATHLAPHGVDHALFARAMDDATVVPARHRCAPSSRARLLRDAP